MDLYFVTFFLAEKSQLSHRVPQTVMNIHTPAYKWEVVTIKECRNKERLYL